MQLCEKKKFDNKCRIQIPKSYVAAAGGSPNSYAYVAFDEESKEIKIILREGEKTDGAG